VVEHGGGEGVGVEANAAVVDAQGGLAGREVGGEGPLLLAGAGRREGVGRVDRTAGAQVEGLALDEAVVEGEGPLGALGLVALEVGDQLELGCGR
jgi:hypothetical protein